MIYISNTYLVIYHTKFLFGDYVCMIYFMAGGCYSGPLCQLKFDDSSFLSFDHIFAEKLLKGLQDLRSIFVMCSIFIYCYIFFFVYF